MSTYDPRVDAYIAKAAEFAQPILAHLREIVHAACPDVTETIKWSFPNFEYGGSVMCNMAAFKQHCAFGFWKAQIMDDPDGILSGTDKNSMGHLGQIRGLADLPADRILKKYVKAAMKLNEDGVKVSRKSTGGEKKELVIPDYVTKALAKHKTAQTAFNNFSYSHKKEYLEWITEAKTEATRDKRLAQMLEWIAEGKSRNWKYIK